MRITLGGGGSDLPSHPTGFCVTAAIDKYVYCAVSQPFTDEIVVHHHLGTERVSRADQIQHRLLRELLRQSGPIELSGISEVPAGTGLGSSSTFTVAALHALHAHRQEYRTRSELAAEACQIEVHHLNDPIGYQDQHAAAWGGLRWMAYDHGHVTTKEIHTDHATWNALNDNLRLFWTGISRSAAAQMGSQPPLQTLIAQGHAAAKALQAGALTEFAHGLTDQWDTKWKAAPSSTHDEIGVWIERGIQAGALGGKLIGAGNGGFLLFYAPPDLDLGLGLKEMPFRLITTGTELIA